MASSSRRSLSATLLGGRRDLLGSEEAGLDALREVDLLLRGQQRDLADLLEVHPYRVGGRGLERELLLLLATRRGALGLVLVALGGGVDELDTLFGQDLQDAVHLLGLELGGLHGRADVFGGDKAGLLALGDEVLDLVDLGFTRQDGGGHDWRLVISSVGASAGTQRRQRGGGCDLKHVRAKSTASFRANQQCPQLTL